jgi:hypothetical protein
MSFVSKHTQWMLMEAARILKLKVKVLLVFFMLLKLAGIKLAASQKF